MTPQCAPPTAAKPYVDELCCIVSPDVDVIGPMPYIALQGMLDAGAPRGLPEARSL
jgi:hypothetical protein